MIRCFLWKKPWFQSSLLSRRQSLPTLPDQACIFSPHMGGNAGCRAYYENWLSITEWECQGFPWDVTWRCSIFFKKWPQLLPVRFLKIIISYIPHWSFLLTSKKHFHFYQVKNLLFKITCIKWLHRHRFMITQRIFLENLIIRKNIKRLLISKYDLSINSVSKPQKN